MGLSDTVRYARRTSNRDNCTPTLCRRIVRRKAAFHDEDRRRAKRMEFLARPFQSPAASRAAWSCEDACRRLAHWATPDTRIRTSLRSPVPRYAGSPLSLRMPASIRGKSRPAYHSKFGISEEWRGNANQKISRTNEKRRAGIAPQPAGHTARFLHVPMPEHNLIYKNRRTKSPPLPLPGCGCE